MHPVRPFRAGLEGCRLTHFEFVICYFPALPFDHAYSAFLGEPIAALFVLAGPNTVDEML